MKKHYDQIVDSYQKNSLDYSEHFPLAHQFIDEDRQKFIKLLGPEGLVLDCGCGPGMDTKFFCEKGLNVTAIDITSNFVAMAAKRASKAQVFNMDMKKLEFNDKSFDGIWSSFSFLHIHKEDAELTLKGFNRVLKDPGLLFLAVHRNEKSRWVKTIVAGIETKSYIQEWNPDDIVKLLKDAGFSVEYARPFERVGGRYPLLSILAKKKKG